MRVRLLSILGYTAAVATLLVALLVPLKLMGGIAAVVAHAGFRIDPMYSGGTALRTLQSAGYKLTIYAPVYPHRLQRGKPFQQVVFEPVQALPAQVTEAIDMNGDGQPDVRVTFRIPSDANAPLHGSVVALNSICQSVPDISNNSFSELLARTGDRIVLRIPLNLK